MTSDTLQNEIARVLAEMGVEAPGEIALERPRNPEHGDLATNVAMTLAKPLRRPPRQIADEIVARLEQTIPVLKNAIGKLSDEDLQKDYPEELGGGPQKTGVMTSLYSSAMGAGATLGAGVSVPLALEC